MKNMPILELKGKSLVNIRVPDIQGLECELWCYEGAGKGIDSKSAEHRKEKDGTLVLIHKGGAVTLTSRFIPSPGAVDIEVTVSGPRKELLEAFPPPADPRELDLGDSVLAPGSINPCWQFKKSPAFGCQDREKYVQDFVARCFVILEDGLTLMKDTKRIPGTRKDRPRVNQPNPWIQEYVPIWRRHPGQRPGKRGYSTDRPVYPIIGVVSRDGRHLAAIAWPETATLGQVWHDCIHPRPRISESYDKKTNEIRSRGKIYFMENDGKKLIAAFKKDFPKWIRPDLRK